MKIKRLLTFVLIMIFVSFAVLMTGCDNKGPGDNDLSSPSKIVTLADFEQFNPDFQLLRLQNGFGQINVNKNEDFVKEGKQSAELRPLGRYSDKADPFFYFELESELYNYSYSDLNYLYSMTMWIYNAQSEDKKMEIGVITHVTNIIALDGAKQVCASSYDLKTGWNKVTYFVEKEEVQRESISSDEDKNKIKGIYVQFENIPSLDINDAPTYYIDNVTLTLKTKYRDIAVEEITYSPREGSLITIPEATIEDGEVTYTVYNNGKIINVTNGQFIPTVAGEYKIVYTATVDGFIFKKTTTMFVKPSNALQVVNFNNSDCMSSLSFSPHVESLEWLSEFEGERGVIKVDMNRDWPAVAFVPQSDKSEYEKYEYIVVRCFFVAGQNQVSYIRLCDALFPEGYGNRVIIGKWVSYKFPIKPFLDNFNAVHIMCNSTDYRVHGYFYISDMYAM